MGKNFGSLLTALATVLSLENRSTREHQFDRHARTQYMHFERAKPAKAFTKKDRYTRWKRNRMARHSRRINRKFNRRAA